MRKWLHICKKSFIINSKHQEVIKMKKHRILKSIVKVYTNINKVRNHRKYRAEQIKQAVYDAFFENAQKKKDQVKLQEISAKIL